MHQSTEKLEALIALALVLFAMSLLVYFQLQGAWFGSMVWAVISYFFLSRLNAAIFRLRPAKPAPEPAPVADVEVGVAEERRGPRGPEDVSVREFYTLLGKYDLDVEAEIIFKCWRSLLIAARQKEV